MIIPFQVVLVSKRFMLILTCLRYCLCCRRARLGVSLGLKAHLRLCVRPLRMSVCTAICLSLRSVCMIVLLFLSRF